MSNEVISIKGHDVIVRDDTAKAFRWRRFSVIVLSGIIAIFIIFILFFSGLFSAVNPDLNQSNTSVNSSQNPGP